MWCRGFHFYFFTYQLPKCHWTFSAAEKGKNPSGFVFVMFFIFIHNTPFPIDKDSIRLPYFCISFNSLRLFFIRRGYHLSIFLLGLSQIVVFCEGKFDIDNGYLQTEKKGKKKAIVIIRQKKDES
jgi:hypothetical protein